MSNDPPAISLEKVADLLRGLGLDPVHVRDVAEVHITPGQVKVVRFRNNADGGRITVKGPDGPSAATETVTIGITG